MLRHTFELVCALCGMVAPDSAGLLPAPWTLAPPRAEWLSETRGADPSIAAPPSPTPAVPPRLSIGEQWQLAGSRTVSLNLTPTREHCAPLFEMMF